MSYIQTIDTPLRVGMILQSHDPKRIGTVCETIVITAIGEESFIARDTELHEHHFRSVNDYKCIGFAKRPIN